MFLFSVCLCAEMRAIRLTGGLDRCSGTVEIHRNGSWGTVCDNCWNKDVASMVCSMLRCGAEPKQYSQFVPPLVHNRGTLWFYTCYPNMQNLWQCKEIINKTHVCQDSKASGVVCNGEWYSFCVWGYQWKIFGPTVTILVELALHEATKLDDLT